MLKRSLTIAIIILFFSLMAWFFMEAMRPEVLPIGSALPDFQYQSALGLESIPPYKGPLIVIWFHEDCGYCVYQLKLFEKHIEDFKGIDLYLLTSDKSFLPKRRERLFPKLLSESDVHWGFLNNSIFRKKFGSTVKPAMYFFDHKGRLFHKITGEMKISGILKIIDSIK